MKLSAMFWVATTTIILIIVTIMAAMGLPFNWVFYSTMIGQFALVYMVYMVLTDTYASAKTFDDFYEDHPIGSRPN
jgi:hypothetical protein